MTASFEPAANLRSRTFLGLIVAQFLAAFNDQAIHAAAMFFAFNKGVLSEAQAINLMPILFYAPWAIFATLAGYLADRFSKRDSLVFWKVAEVAITAVALLGFWLGSTRDHPSGPWIVLSTVFLMGMHSAFFVPAKYGVMPEILQPHLLSKGNGVLESTSFIGVILGTVFGGVLTSVFRTQEYWIGAILFVLAVVGAVASLLIRRMPAANPDRPFPARFFTRGGPRLSLMRQLLYLVLIPYDLFRPLAANLRNMVRSQPLAVAVVGIAFFTFLVAFLRATIYMHGQSQVPRLEEWETSLIVGMVALGVGLGSPLAGFLSGGKIELGIIGIGAVGLILGTVAAAGVLTAVPTAQQIPLLIGCIIWIGFFTGFYLVPLFTLLQARAPKASKGDTIATSNFLNVTGAILASIVMALVVGTAHRTGVVPTLPQTEVARGLLVNYRFAAGHVAEFEIEQNGKTRRFFRRQAEPDGSLAGSHHLDHEDEFMIEMAGLGLRGREVIVTSYRIKNDTHLKIRRAGTPEVPAYNNEGLPPFLFLGAAGMTLLTLLVIWRRLPDLGLRALFWLTAWGYRVKATGVYNLPSSGPVILATNAATAAQWLEIVAATDRYVRLVLAPRTPSDVAGWYGYLAAGDALFILRPDSPDSEAWEKQIRRAARVLEEHGVLALPVGSETANPAAERFFRDLQEELRDDLGANIVPATWSAELGGRMVRVVFSEPLMQDCDLEELRRGTW